MSVYTGPVDQSEVDCLWDSGVRHVIVGTQNPELSAQQLDMAVREGMTVDLYVYVYWSRDIKAQVQQALDLAQGRPVGRIWLDLEDSSGGRSVSTLKGLVQQGLDACGSMPCDIYTGPNFWKTTMGDTTSSRDRAPLVRALQREAHPR